jgi:hypothetical protein
VRAIYHPAAGFAGSEGTTTQTVGLVPTTTVAGTDPTSSVFGQVITITAAVSSGLGPVSGGTVTFYDGGGGCGSGAALGSDQVSSGSASISASNLSVVSAHRLWACYSGTATVFGASGDDVLHQVSPAATQTSISVPTTSSVGEGVIVSATVAALGPGSGTPTGLVTVSATDGASCAPPIDLSNGTGSCTLIFATAGLKGITASYQGDGNFNVSLATADHTVTSEF